MSAYWGPALDAEVAYRQEQVRAQFGRRLRWGRRHSAPTAAPPGYPPAPQTPPPTAAPATAPSAAPAAAPTAAPAMAPTIAPAAARPADARPANGPGAAHPVPAIPVQRGVVAAERPTPVAAGSATPDQHRSGRAA